MVPRPDAVTYFQAKGHHTAWAMIWKGGGSVYLCESEANCAYLAASRTGAPAIKKPEPFSQFPSLTMNLAIAEAFVHGSGSVFQMPTGHLHPIQPAYIPPPPAPSPAASSSSKLMSSDFHHASSASPPVLANHATISTAALPLRDGSFRAPTPAAPAQSSPLKMSSASAVVPPRPSGLAFAQNWVYSKQDALLQRQLFFDQGGAITITHNMPDDLDFLYFMPPPGTAGGLVVTCGEGKSCRTRSVWKVVREARENGYD